VITFQFSTEAGIGSWAIRAFSEEGRDRFTPSHVDLVVPPGNNRFPQGGLYGARMKGGVALRPEGYAHFTRTRRFSIPCSSDVESGFYWRAFRQWQKPYDMAAIVAFAVPGYDWRNTGRWECSALQAWAAEESGLFRRLAVAGSRVTPRDLMLVVSAVAA
jgi:hypothetical protein